MPVQWQLQTSAGEVQTWTCQYGYVHVNKGTVTFGLWGKESGSYVRPTIEAAKASCVEAGERIAAQGIENALMAGDEGEFGTCLWCLATDVFGTKQGGPNPRRVLCFQCQSSKNF